MELASKPHYAILDGLRGVAAVIVVAFHICEAHATSPLNQIINHGYLAVDFFFALSGFVIGYAYDDRWKLMTVKDFFKRRLIRLQPMLILGMLIGAACFYFQDSVTWPGISEVPVWKMLLIMLIGCTLLPVPPSMDIRGWWEMHPLNGPAWSLFFEYIANILYALILRRVSKVILTILVILAGAALIHLAVTSPGGDLIGGWALESTQFRIGLTRMLYPFLAGLLLSRVIRIRQVRHAFLWCTLLIVAILAFPRLGGDHARWMNGLYDSLSVVLLFPIILIIGAGGKVTEKMSSKFCRFLGDISYPIYITHFPFIYIYTGYVQDHKLSLMDALPISLLTFSGTIIIAYLSFRLYDLPIRKWLTKKIYVKAEKNRRG